MEPAITKRWYKCPEWERFARAAHDVGRMARISGQHGGTFSQEFFVRGVKVRVAARQKYPPPNYPPNMTYYLAGARMTPKMFSEYFNDLIEAPPGWEA